MSSKWRRFEVLLPLQFNDGSDVDMSQALPLPPPGFDSLSVDEQIDYVQSLWDHIAARPEDVPVPDWHRKILAERLENLHNDPDTGKSWEEFGKELAGDMRTRNEG
jgi:putative addiction module component (TIGR02574 family)